jgi:hypothetical protein
MVNKIHDGRGDGFSGINQIAFIFTTRVVDQNNHFAIAKVV